MSVSEKILPARQQQKEWQISCGREASKFLFDTIDQTGGRDTFVFTRETYVREFARSGGSTDGLNLNIVRVSGRDSRKPFPDFSAAAQAILQRIRHVYKLEIELRRPLTKKKKLKFEVRDEEGKKVKGLQFARPRYLFPLKRPGQN